MPAKLVGVKAGEEIELSRELVVTPFATRHTIPSLGYLVWERRKKLKPEYQHLIGDDLAIRDLRQIRRRGLGRDPDPKVAYLGDSAPQGLDALPEIYDAEILILEMTFVAPQERPEKIHKFGHTHLDDIIARADRFENDWVIASHFSTRLHPDQIQRIVEKRLPEPSEVAGSRSGSDPDQISTQTRPSITLQRNLWSDRPGMVVQRPVESWNRHWWIGQTASPSSTHPRPIGASAWGHRPRRA